MGLLKRAWLAPAAALVPVVAVFAAVFAPSAMATTPLTISKTATAHWTRTFEWTIDKSVTPDSHALETGESGTSTYTVAVTKSVASEAMWVDGEVCVTNNGTVPTENLAIEDRLIAFLPAGGFQTLVNTLLDVSANPVLDPGESHCYPYSFPFEPYPGATGYANRAFATITNDPREPGTPLGPRVDAPFVVPASPELINDQVNVDDTNGLSWLFTDSGSQSYTRTFTCDEDEGQHDNTATIRETGQSDDASVTVTCTPPPPPPGNQGCTPGFWKNHPAAFAGTGVMPSSSLSSVGFNVAPALTFQQALELNGGGLNALLRHAAAAYLNAASPSVNYPFTTAQVVSMTNSAIASGNYEPTKDQFDDANNLGTPGFCD
jgi:hypothetical protein